MFGGPAYGHIHLEMTDDQPAVKHVYDQSNQLQPEGCARAARARHCQEKDLSGDVDEVGSAHHDQCRNRGDDYVRDIGVYAGDCLREETEEYDHHRNDSI